MTMSETNGKDETHLVAPEAGLSTADRRDRVLELLRRSRFASVANMATQFGVSEVTIRNDLDVLAEEGRIQRVRGGAIHRATVSLEASFEQAEETLAEEKRAIAAAAAALVESGQTVLLDSGTTTAAIARALAARTDLHEVTVFTNGLRVAMELEPAIPQITVVLAGGVLRKQQHSLVNPFGLTVWDRIHGHIAFLECQGIDAQAGVTHSNIAEAEIKRAILSSGRYRVVVADGSKVGQVGLVHVFGIDEISLLLTDRTADPGAIAALQDCDLDVRVAGESAADDVHSLPQFLEHGRHS